MRLLYNVAHPGPIPVPPPPETAPDAIEALPVATRGIAGIPDLMHHKFVVRDAGAVWTGSTNWTDDSWSRQENVIVTVDSHDVAYAYALAFGQLWESGRVAHSGKVDPRPEDVGSAQVRAWFCPEHGEALSHRVAKQIGKARERVRIASPVLTSGPILATLVEVVNEKRCDVAGVVDDTQVDQVFGQWRTNGVSEWKVPLLQRVIEGAVLQRQVLDSVVADVAPRLHAREGRRRRRHVVRRELQLLALGRAERGERARDPRRRDRRPARLVRRRGSRALPACHRPCLSDRVVAMTIDDVLGAELATGRAVPTAETGEPYESWHVISDDGRVELGIWEVTPGSFRGSCDGYYEQMHFVAGRGSITDAAGRGHRDPAGRRHALPGRLVGCLEVEETVRKTYAVVKTG